jgi:hypothetical protein
MVCSGLNTVRCTGCAIPVCDVCCEKWFVGSENRMCVQCMIDCHSDWTQQEIHTYLVQAWWKNYPQISEDSSLSADVKWAMMEYAVRRY